MKKMHSAQAMWHAGFKAAVLIAAALPAFAVQALQIDPWVSCDTEEKLQKNLHAIDLLAEAMKA